MFGRRRHGVMAMYFISLGALLAVATLHFFGLLDAAPRSAALRPSEPLAVFQQRPRNVYFDIGANNGDSILEFLEQRSALAWDVVLPTTALLTFLWKSSGWKTTMQARL
jgi:hypothetical protein